MQTAPLSSTPLSTIANPSDSQKAEAPPATLPSMATLETYNEKKNHPLAQLVMGVEANSRNSLFSAMHVVTPSARLSIFQRVFQDLETALAELDQRSDEAKGTALNLRELKDRLRSLQDSTVAVTLSAVGVEGLTTREAKAMLTAQPALYGMSPQQAESLRQSGGAKLSQAGKATTALLLETLRTATQQGSPSVFQQALGLVESHLPQLDALLTFGRMGGMSGQPDWLALEAQYAQIRQNLSLPMVQPSNLTDNKVEALADQPTISQPHGSTAASSPASKGMGGAPFLPLSIVT